MHRRTLESFALALALSAYSTVARAQLLHRASGVVRGTSSSSSRSSGNGSGWRGSSGASSGLAPPRLIWSAYPYARMWQGYARPVDEGTGFDGRTSVRLSAEGGYVLGGAGRGAVSARVQFSRLFDLAAGYALYVEPLGGGRVDAVALGRLGFDIRVIETPNALLRVGMGLRHFHDAIGDVFGVDGAVGVDLFPGAPWVLSAEGGAGRIDQATLVFARATVGVMLGAVEVYAGYDHVGLLSDGDQVMLGGPLLGLRGWL